VNSSGAAKILFGIAIIVTISSQLTLPHVFAIRTMSPQTSASLTEWTVPTPQSGPWALTLDQSGECCWFLEYYGNKIAHFDPRTNVFQEWPIPTANSNPYSIAITTISGMMTIWGTEFGSDKVFAFSPRSGSFEEYSLQRGNTGVGYISVEPPGGVTRVWFTETTRNSNGEFIYDTKTGNVTFYEDTFPTAVGGGAYGVYAGTDSVWFAGFSALVRWDRASQQYTLYPLPSHGSAVGRFLTFDSHGELWYTQGVANQSSADNFVGVLRGNIVQEWRIPVPGSNPRGISINPLTQQPWVVEQSTLGGNESVAYLNDLGNGTLYPTTPLTSPSGGPPRVLSPTITQATEAVQAVAPTTSFLPSSEEGPFVQYVLGSALPGNVVVDSSGSVWISEPGANKIARLSVSNPDYALSLSSSHISLAASVPLAVTGTSVSGYTGSVTFKPTNLPAGVALSGFDPNPVNVPLGGNASSNFEINISPTAPPGTHLVVVQGSDGTNAHTVSIVITIANSTNAIPSQQFETRCSVAVPTYLPGSVLLSSLIVDVLIGGFYIGLPIGNLGRKVRFLHILSRRSWLVIFLLAPSALFLGSALFLFLC